MIPYYRDDLVTLYHGDCREVLPALAGADLLLTDPPYGINVETRSDGRGVLAAGRAWERVEGDSEPFDPRSLLPLAKRAVLFGANHYAHLLPPSSMWIVWDKVDDLPTIKREVGFNNMADVEMAWTNLPGPARLFRHRWMGYFRKTEATNRLHPTQKPVALMRWIVANWTKPGDLVVDPYMGSGPVAKACQEERRRYVGVELVESYCEAAVGRLAQDVLDFGESA